jgi:hypothetical protein
MSKHKNGKTRRLNKKRAQRKAYRARKKVKEHADVHG